MVHRHGNFHDRMVELARRQDAVFSTEGGTVYSIVYQTATPTFTGVIGGYTTLAGDDSTTDSAPTPASSDANAPAAAPTTANDSPSPVQPSTAATQTTASATNATPLTSAIVASTSTTAILGSTNTANVAAASTTANSSSSDSSSSGMSTGAKAGIAIAVIAIVGLLAVFLLWLLGKKRRQLEAQKTVDNEKHVPGAGTIAAASVNSTEMATRSPPISATAPRISLRPVSRMLPEFMGASKSRLSGGNLLNTIGEADSITSRKTPSPGPRGPSPTQPRGLGLGQPVRPSEDNNPFADPKNPFADPEKSSVEYPAPLAITPSVTKQAPIAPMAATIVGAAATSAAVAPKPAPTRAAAPGPAPAPALVSAPVSEPTPVIAPVPAAAPAPVPVPIAVPAPKPAQESAPSPTSSGPASPALSSTPSQGAEPQGNVYRVLMDFAPSMEDELELKSGQLVRLLHEYDDGWVSTPKTFCRYGINVFLGFVHSTRPISTRCCPSNMPCCQALEA